MNDARAVVALGALLLGACADEAPAAPPARDASASYDASAPQDASSANEGVAADECSDPRGEDCGPYANYTELSARTNFGCHWDVRVDGATISQGDCASAWAHQFFYYRKSEADPCRSAFQLSGRSEDGRTTMNASLTNRGKWSEAQPFTMQASGKDRQPQVRTVDRSHAEFSLRIGVSGDPDFLSMSCGISRYLTQEGTSYDEVAVPSNDFALQVESITDVCWAQRDYEQFRLEGSLRGSCVASRTPSASGMPNTVLTDFVVSFGGQSNTNR